MTQETWSWFKSFTTISGLGQTFASTEKHWKGLWGILTFGLIIVTGYSVFKTLCDYFAYNVTTSFSIDHTHSLSIPSVTICNINRVHCGNLLQKVETYVNKNEPVSNQKKLCELFMLSGCDISIQVAEQAIDGNITSNFDICKDVLSNSTYIFHLHKNLEEDQIEQAFLDIYLKLNQVCCNGCNEI